MPDFETVIAAAGTAFLIAGIGTGLLRRVLVAKDIVDRPNARSSHHDVKPRGGGIALMAAIAAGLTLLHTAGVALPDGIVVVGWTVLILSFISWLDDVRNLSAIARIIPQIICVTVVLYLLPGPELPILTALPAWAQSVVLALAWLWFINLYNFMDGIDGITGIETLVITLGIAVLSVTGSGLEAFQGPVLVIAAAACGFLIWNWSPAKIFMGDVGSIPIGFILGWVLLKAADEGYLLAALILPAYYLLDATITLLIRLVRSEKIWQAHRQHAYQRAVQNGLSHANVAILVGLAGIILIFLGAASSTHPWPAGLAAYIVALVLWLYLRKSKP